MTWKRICSLDELRDGARLAKSFKDLYILIFKLGDDIFAYEDRCPHAGAPLNDGRINKGHLTCRHHHWEFDLRTGASIRPKGSKLRPFETKIEDGAVFVSISP